MNIHKQAINLNIIETHIADHHVWVEGTIGDNNHYFTLNHQNHHTRLHVHPNHSHETHTPTPATISHAWVMKTLIDGLQNITEQHTQKPATHKFLHHYQPMDET